jgi:putative ABC transport system permease protein
MFRRLRLRLRTLFTPARVQAERDDEMRFHLEQQARLYAAQGIPAEAAERRARLAYGLVETRDADGARDLAEVVRDVRYSLRTLWHDRGLAIAGVLTLALGIGATTAVFSAVNAVMLRELPFADSDRLVAVWEENPERNWYKEDAAPANYLDWRDRVRAFEGLAGYTDFLMNVTLVGEGEPRILAASDVTGNFLPVLGVRPAVGRGFEPADDWDNGQRPLLISHRVWRELFRSDSSVVGRTVSLGDGRRWQIVGVMPEQFAFPTPATDVWKPMLWKTSFRSQVFFRRAHWMRVVGRLRPGVTAGQAEAQLKAVARQLEAEYPATNARMGAGITPIREWIVGDTRMPLIVLLAAAGILLLIACVNVGNLLLVHALGRSRDVALRFALGATRARVARQALTESLVLSALGGAGGFAVGWVGARALLAMQPEGMLPVTEISLDARLCLFAIALTTLSGLLFGLAPTLIATRQAPADALSASGRTFAGGGVGRWARHLVVAEVALAVVLTIGAGLLLRSYHRLANVPAGFDARGVMTATLGVPRARYDSARKVIDFYESLLERVRSLPGVERAAAVRQLPATESSWSSGFSVAGRAPYGQASVLHREVLGDYFRVMRVPLIEGRPFDDRDAADGPPVAIVNEAFVKEFFPNESPMGLRISFERVPDSTSTWRTIVGVVGSERQGSLATPPRPEVFAPFAQDLGHNMTIVARMQEARDPMSVAAPIRQAVRELDSLLAITALRPMTDVHSRALSRERFIGVLVGVFAATGMVLALVGVFGVLAQLVQTRWRELGIRLALGARGSQVRWLVVRHAAALLVLGIAAGLLVASGATRVLGTLLYEVRPLDALTYAAVALIIALTGLLAAWIPARRASGADPAVTLRTD